MERAFGKLRKSDRSSDDFTNDWSQSFRADGISWTELLKFPRILLVSEAGAGKSYECEQQASSLFNLGEAAFFLPLERLAAGGVASILYGVYLERFQQWMASSSQIAYFFLDSIDELHLVHGSFRDALKRLAHDLEGALGRARIVVTSRPVVIDRRAFKEVLPIPEPASEALDGEEFVRIAIHGPNEEKQDKPLPFLEVELLPLTDQQIIEFSRDRGIVSPEALLLAIDARHARDFARRPQDLIELCDDWREHGEIRSHFEQVKSHILARLAARPERREKADLSIERAFLGAQRLALAAILGRRLTIRYSAGADTQDSGGAPIDPRILLQGWTAKEIAALLERPIFAEGGYGRVRFHHRSVMEYLAACQIHQLIESGTISECSAKRLIFGLTNTNDRLLKPSMRPVAGWLSLIRRDMFDAVLEVEPSTLLTHGDPESLTDSQRERALLAFVERYGKGQRRGLEVPDLQVTRLAQVALSETILAAWNNGVENPEVRELLLRLISAGRFQKCADLAASVARDASCSDQERFEAIVALSNLGDARLGAFIEAAVALAPGWTERMARWIGTFLYPEHVSDTQLLQLLSNVRVKSRRGGDYADRVARVVEKADLSTSRLEALLPGLLALTRNTVEVREDALVDQEGKLEASSILRVLCIRLLERGAKSNELIQASVLAQRASEAATGMRKGSPELRAFLDALPSELRQHIFEEDLACIALFKLERDVRYRYVRLVYEGALSYTKERDWLWVIAALTQTEVVAECRAVLLQLAVYLSAEGGSGAAEFDAIRRAVEDSPALMTQLNEAIEANKPNETVLRMQEEQRKRQERQQRKLEVEREDWLAFWREVANRPVLALAPGRLNSTIWNLWLVLRKKGPGGDDGRWDRAFLETHFGHEVTNALRRALMSYWRSMKPSVRSERKVDEKNTYLVVWSIGLMGIYAEAEEAAWAARLSTDEAELAARYSLLELNGLPNWLIALAEAHAIQVDRVIGDELNDELAEPPGKERWHSMLLQGLRHGPSQLAQLLQPRLIAWLSGPGEELMQLPHSEFGESKLDQVVRVLITHGDQSIRRALEDLAGKQVEAAGDGPFLFFWLPVLCGLNPARGIAVLLKVLDGLPVEQDGVAVRAIGSLFNERRTDGSTNWSSTLTADSLLELTLAIYRHVRAEDDLVHDNGYSPGSRDHAEDARRYVFDALMQASGPEAMRAKLALAAHKMFGHLRDRIAALAQERLAAEVDSSFAEMTELAGLFEGKELPPKTGTDMAQLLVDRLDDLQELMLRDTGPRAAWAMVSDENTLRPAIARELEVAARGAYTVDQEAVTVDGKETDIRLRSVSGYQATIELKVGEKSRSGRELRDTVEDQLVKKYMAHKMAKAGCLLVTVSNPNKCWQHPETKSRIDRFQLQELLDDAAQAAQQRLGGDARVMARVLDLTPRLVTEAEAAVKPAPPAKHPSARRKRATTSKARSSA